MGAIVEIECVLPAADRCGESPVWDPATGTLYWLDIYGRRLHALDAATGAHRLWPLPELVASIGRRRGGGLVAGMGSGFGFIDTVDGTVRRLADPRPDVPNFRINDGKCDRAGRFWSGTVDTATFGAHGALYRLDPDHTSHRVAGSFVTPNGIAFSPDDRVMYLADSRSDVVYAFDFDLERGAVRNRRVFVSTADIPARVDGATVDADGCYWCAHVRDWRIARYDPQGRLVTTIALPVRHPLLCTFGGANLDVLYVTTGTFLLEPGEAAAQPLAGALFALHGTGARGLPEPEFLG